jgi:HlyD family secretion protein
MWTLAVVVPLGGFWWYAMTRPVPVDVAEVRRGPIRAFVEEEGKTRVIDRYVVSAPVAGRLQRLQLDEGDPVQRGDLLAVLDPLQLSSRIEEAQAQVRALRHRISGVETLKPKEAELERARVLESRAREGLEVALRELGDEQAGLVRAQKKAERIRALHRRGSATDADLDTCVMEETQAGERVRAQELRVKMRRLEVDAAGLNARVLEAKLHDYDWEEAEYKEKISAIEAGLAALRDDLQRTRILAPTTGIVLKLLEESERHVAAGTPILEMGDPTRLEVEAEFLSEDAAHMRVGMAAEIFGRALGSRLLPSRVRRIYPSAFKKISSLGVEQQRVQVILSIDPKVEGLGDRYRVEARVILDERPDAVLVPEGALFRGGGGWQVFRLVDGRARLAAVRTGLRDGRTREVLEGLAAGDRVVLHPEADLEDGDRVEPLPGARR